MLMLCFNRFNCETASSFQKAEGLIRSFSGHCESFAKIRFQLYIWASYLWLQSSPQRSDVLLLGVLSVWYPRLHTAMAAHRRAHQPPTPATTIPHWSRGVLMFTGSQAILNTLFHWPEDIIPFYKISLFIPFFSHKLSIILSKNCSVKRAHYWVAGLFGPY